MAMLRNYDINHLREKLAQEWAKENGYASAVGGWVTRPTGGRKFHGWMAVWDGNRGAIMDRLTVKNCPPHTSFSSMVNDSHSYTPLLDLKEDWRLILLALDYNRAQVARQDPRRVVCVAWPETLDRWVLKELRLLQ